jgi:glutaredoxin 3
MIRPITTLLLCLTLIATACLAAEKTDAPQTPLSQGAPQAKKYPLIVLYSVAWCPHCKAAKEYFTANNIPFINKDVELDDKAMTELKEKYKSGGVPVIVIGDDVRILKGFDQKKFEKALQEVTK